MTRRGGFDLIPSTAQALAAGAFLLPTGLCFWLMDGHSHVGFRTAAGMATGVLLAAFVLLTGYVYGDAARRGMPAGLWAALVFLVPNGIGFLLYFALRKPVGHPCPNCAGAVSQEFAFCPRCGRPQIQQPAAG